MVTRTPEEAVEALSASCLPCELAAQTADVDVSERPEEWATWEGILTYEGQMTGDGRIIEHGALRWDTLPIPLRWAEEDNGAHAGARVVGRITEIERREDGAIFAKGDFDLGSDHGKEAARQVKEGLTPGVSIDLDDVNFGVWVASDNEIENVLEDVDEAGRVKMMAMNSDDEVMITTSGRIRAATLVAIQAFEPARLALAASVITITAAFNENQARVPKGNGRLSGRWIDMPGTLLSELVARIGSKVEGVSAAPVLSRAQRSAEDISITDNDWSSKIKGVLDELDDAHDAAADGGADDEVLDDITNTRNELADYQGIDWYSDPEFDPENPDAGDVPTGDDLDVEPRPTEDAEGNVDAERARYGKMYILPDGTKALFVGIVPTDDPEDERYGFEDEDGNTIELERNERVKLTSGDVNNWGGGGGDQDVDDSFLDGIANGDDEGEDSVEAPAAENPGSGAASRAMDKLVEELGPKQMDSGTGDTVRDVQEQIATLDADPNAGKSDYDRLANELEDALGNDGVDKRDDPIKKAITTIRFVGKERGEGRMASDDIETFDSDPDTNWVEETGTGHLPNYIRRIADHLIAQGMAESRAIASAVNTVKRWARGGSVRADGGPNVKPDTIAKAAAALAEWEAKKAQAKASSVLPAKAMTASGYPMQPPAAWFADPKLTGPTPLKVEKSGRVYGHLAAWGTCHTGYPNSCVTAPSSRSGYAYFKTGSVYTDIDTEFSIGVVTMDTLHADKNLSGPAALAHYENTGRQIADIAVGEDAYGIWVAGALRPDVTDEQVRALRASPLSGDWRRVGGSLELIAALAVNVPGFPIPRVEGITAGGAMKTLVAAGMINPALADIPSDTDLTDLDKTYLKQMAARERKRIEDEAAALALEVEIDEFAHTIGI